MQDTRRLSDLARDEIDALVSEGIAVTPADVVRINALSWDVECPESRLALSRGVPVFVGTVPLWPSTLAALDWFARVGCRFPTRTARGYALAYSMAHGYSEGPELTHTGARALAAVLTWAARLRCRLAVLEEAVAQVLAQDAEEPDPPAETDEEQAERDARALTSAQLVARLSVMTGIPAAEWERRVTFRHALDVFRTCQEQDKADGQTTMTPRRIKAERALGLALERIRHRGK
jgi:hypothetical protein